MSRVLAAILCLVVSVSATTYYIAPASGGGSDSNNGTSSGTPWLSPNHAVNCGDVILAAAGAYDEANFRVGAAQWHSVSCASGNDVAWLKCATAFTCTITITTAGHDAMAPSQSYWGIQGWVVSATTVSTNQCFNAYTDGAPVKHHIIFANNVANGCGDGALTSAWSDYVYVIGNIAYNGAQDNDNCYSGIDLVSMDDADTVPGTHSYIAGNFAWGNVDPNPCGGGVPTDGHGLSLDSYDTKPYHGQTLIENNISVFNGAAGFQNFASTSGAQVYVRYNTFYGNQTGSVNANPCAELNVNDATLTQSDHNLVMATTNTCHSAVAEYALGSSFDATSDIFYNNFIYSAAGNNTNGNLGRFVNNTSGTSPAFVNPVQPSAPNCTGHSTTVACMATLIANFTPTTTAAKGYGYQPVVTTAAASYDPLFPQWLCGVTNLPAGLIQMHCGAPGRYVSGGVTIK